MNIYIVISAFNEEKHIGKVVEEISSKNVPLIVVDDGSTDETFNITRKTRNVLVLKHKINLGKGAAMKTGAEAAFLRGADAVVFMDADGQHKIEDFRYFKDALGNGFDVVFGSRNLSHGVPLIRYMGNKFASVLISILFGIYISDILSGYRAVTKRAFKKIEWESSGYGVETEIVINTALANLRHCEVPVATVYLDKVKGVTLLDAVNILGDVIRWKVCK